MHSLYLSGLQKPEEGMEILEDEWIEILSNMDQYAEYYINNPAFKKLFDERI